jgi:hypothetical protein
MERERRGGIVFPILLVAAGLFWLLSTLGVIDWSVWQSLLALWPIVLIGIGLDLLIGRRSLAGSMLVALVVLALLLGGAWYLSGSSSAVGGPLTHTISQPLEGASRARLKIRSGGGTLVLGPGPGTHELIEGMVKLRLRQDVRESFRLSGDTATYELTGSGTSNAMTPTFGRGSGETWDLQVNPAIAIDLDLGVGAGEARVDLEKLNLTGLRFAIGVGSATVILPERGGLKADMSNGVGSLVVQLPLGVPARIKADSGIGKVDVRGAFERAGDVYTSPGYAGAENAIDVTAHTGIGDIVLEPYGGG